MRTGEADQFNKGARAGRSGRPVVFPPVDVGFAQKRLVMIDTFFQIQGRPFVAAPRHDRYFAGEAIEAARQVLTRCIERAEGPGLVVGPAGVGKSTLCQVLAHQFRDQLRVVMLRSARLCTRRALLQSILSDFGLPYSNMDEGELRLSLTDHLDPGEKGEGSVLMLIDEADALPVRLLEELRALTNLVRDGVPCLRMVLVGGPTLEEKFAGPSLESFNQRLACRCYLDSFSRDDTFQYILAQIDAVGGAPELLTEDAMQSVYVATDGVPRLINQLCDHAMVMAVVGDHAQVDAPLIEEAWADLQQLPAPRNLQDQAANGQEGDIIAFGALDDDLDDPWNDSTEGEMAGVDGPKEKLEEIEQQVEEIVAQYDSPVDDPQIDSEKEEDDANEFQPAGVIGPEIELLEEDAADPFSEKFDDEEIVIDRPVEIDNQVLTSLQLVSSNEGRDIAGMLSSMDPPVRPAMETESPLEESAVAQLDEVCEAVDKEAFDPALDPIYPEPAVPQDQPPAPAESKEDGSRLTVPVWEDDRDLIVVTNDTSEKEETTSVGTEGKAYRQEYRQLFARLRRG